jgi:hypothetical protein
LASKALTSLLPLLLLGPPPLSATSGGLPPPPEGGIGPTHPSLIGTDAWFLLLGIAWFGIAVFLLNQGVAFQRWATSSDEQAPNPRSGVQSAWIISIIIIALWALYWLVYNKDFIRLYGLLPALLGDLFNDPREFAQLPILASITPTAVALFKFLLSASAMRGTFGSSGSITRSPAPGLVAALFSAVNLAGSIATLITFFRLR